LFDFLWKRIEEWSMPVGLTSLCAFLFGGMKGLISFLAFWLVADLLAAWYLQATKALERRKIANGSKLYGFVLGCKDGTISPDIMLCKFFPKCMMYLLILAALSLMIKGFRDIGWEYEAYNFAQVIAGILTAREVKSTMRNLRESGCPIYDLIGAPIENYYDNKYGCIPKQEEQQPEVVEVPEDRPKAGNH
jgi:hypothetical protein